MRTAVQGAKELGQGRKPLSARDAGWGALVAEAERIQTLGRIGYGSSTRNWLAPLFGRWPETPGVLNPVALLASPRERANRRGLEKESREIEEPRAVQSAVSPCGR